MHCRYFTMLWNSDFLFEIKDFKIYFIKSNINVFLNLIQMEVVYLKSLYTYSYLSFLSNQLSAKIDSPESLSRVSFNIPCRRTRSSFPFHIPFPLLILTLLSPSKVEPCFLRHFIIVYYIYNLYIFIIFINNT